MNTGQMYNVVAAQVTTELEPGASRTITWNQEDGNGNNVPTGDYTATVQATSLSSSSAQSTSSSQVSFEITE
jgi:flagellar hook assembly protein FlgD